MTNNVVNVGSANIAQLGFLAYFDLDQQILLLDITGQTLFVGSGANNVVGISFNIVAPGGLVLGTVDFTAPNILPASASTFQINLPGFYSVFGFWTIQAQIKDQDGTVYSTANIVKEITQPDGYTNGKVPGVISIEADCDVPQLLITEQTVMVYQGDMPTAIIKAGTLSYPRGTLADLDFTSTPFLVAGAGFVYTGRYTLTNKSLANYDIGDGIEVIVAYVVNQFEKLVDCNNGITALVCCVDEVYNRYISNPFSRDGKAAKAQLDEIAIPFYLAILKSKSGQDNSDEITLINKALNCDCGCGSNAIEPKPLVGNGLTGLNINVTASGSNAAAVTSSTSGSTKTFNIIVKNLHVVNSANDTSFSITRGESSTVITYGITFNYTNLATKILQTIQNDDDLTTLFRLIAGAAGAAVSLAGLNSSCVLTLGNCNYSLIEGTTPVKKINSITIAGTVHNAPTNLLLTDASGIASWLNGLGLGTFTSVYDSGSLTTVISSNGNPNPITQLSLNIGGGTVLRQFTKTCVGLVDVLNAITTYICAIDTTKVKFGVPNQRISSFQPDGSVTTVAIDPASYLSTVMAQILAAQAILFNAIALVALNCANMKTLFAVSGNTLTDADYVFGTKGGACARLSYQDMAAQLLTDIANSPSLQSAFCAIVATCSAPSCPPVSNVSGVLASGTLTVNCNDASPSTSLQVRYRIVGTSTYANTVVLASALPAAVGSSLTNGLYEIGINKLCTNGAYSGWVTGFSNACAVPVSFGVTNDGTQFVVAATLSGSQTRIIVTMTDANGGVSSFNHDFGGVSGTFNIPYVSGVYGNYTFAGSAVCDNTTTPKYQSANSSPVIVNYPNPVADNVTASPSFTMSFTDIRNGSATGVPTAFNSVVISSPAHAHSASLSAGTISVVIAGTIPIGLTLMLRLVNDSVGTVDSVPISGAGTYILTNGGTIAFPTSWTITIDSV